MAPRPTLIAAAAALALSAAPPARAAFVVTMTPGSPYVTATGSGTLNTAALQPYATQEFGPAASPSDALLVFGPFGQTAPLVFWGVVDQAPDDFGTGFGAVLDDASGAFIGVYGPYLLLPQDFVSGQAYAASLSFGFLDAQGPVRPGTYVWSWGSGETADSFTLRIGATPGPGGPPPEPVPAPPALPLLGLALAGLCLATRTRRAA